VAKFAGLGKTAFQLNYPKKIMLIRNKSQAWPG